MEALWFCAVVEKPVQIGMQISVYDCVKTLGSLSKIATLWERNENEIGSICELKESRNNQQQYVIRRVIENPFLATQGGAKVVKKRKMSNRDRVHLENVCHCCD